jgi:hypothetical protein
VSEHVSTFELDVYFVSREGDAIAAHVATCAACAAYLASLEALQADGAALPERPLPRRRSPLRVVAPAAGVLALAAGLLLWARSRAAEDEAYVGVKGAPALQVLVRDRAQTRVWDGRSPVHGGDAIALGVACEAYAHVTVATTVDGKVMRLWDGPCAAGGAPLPFTLQVDEEPGHERFAVVLGRRAPDEGALADALRTGARSDAVWVFAVDLPKETSR